MGHHRVVLRVHGPEAGCAVRFKFTISVWTDPRRWRLVATAKFPDRGKPQRSRVVQISILSNHRLYTRRSCRQCIGADEESTAGNARPNQRHRVGRVLPKTRRHVSRRRHSGLTIQNARLIQYDDCATGWRPAGGGRAPSDVLSSGKEVVGPLLLPSEALAFVFRNEALG